MSDYQTCGCGANCYIRGLEEDTKGRCWGRVHAIAKVEPATINTYIHACSGHRDLYIGGEYHEEVEG